MTLVSYGTVQQGASVLEPFRQVNPCSPCLSRATWKTSEEQKSPSFQMCPFREGLAKPGSRAKPRKSRSGPGS